MDVKIYKLLCRYNNREKSFVNVVANAKSECVY
jgi:hypothetical protein